MATTGLAWTVYLLKRQETKSKPSGHLWQHRKVPRGVPQEHRAWRECVPFWGRGTRWSVRSLPSQTTPGYCEWAGGQTGTLFHLAKNANNVLMAPGYSGRAGAVPGKGRTNTAPSRAGRCHSVKVRATQGIQLHTEQWAPCWTCTPSTGTHSWVNLNLPVEGSPSPGSFFSKSIPATDLASPLSTSDSDSLTPFTHWAEKPPSQAEEFAR